MSTPHQPRPTTSKQTTWADPGQRPSGFQTPRREPTNEEIALIESGAHLAPAPPTPPRKRRRKGRAIVGGVIVAGLIGGVGYYAVSPEQRSTDAWEAANITAVVIEVAAGDVTISESADTTARYNEDLHYRGTPAQTTHRVEGTTLIITSNKGGITLAGPGMKRDYNLQVPKGAKVTYKQSAGNLSINGQFGEVRIESSAGEVESRGLTATSVSIDMSAGNVDLKDVDTDKLTLEQSAGNTDVDFSTAPDDVTLDVSAGNVDMTVPDGTYDVTKKVSAGNVEVKVPTGASDHDIDIQISAGNVDIRPR